MSFCEAIIKQFKGKKIKFQGNARLDQLDEEVLSNLKKAGCRRLGIGLESGSQKILDILDKDINIIKDLPNINKIKKYGIESHVWVMIGIPGETEKDILETIEMTKNLDVSSVEINIATPWPGTYFYEDAKRKEWLIKSEIQEFDEKKKSFFKTPYLSPEKVQELFEEFKAELKKEGWIQWSHESNTFAKKPPFKEIFKKALKKLRRKEIYWSDFSILKDWIKNVKHKV